MFFFCEKSFLVTTATTLHYTLKTWIRYKEHMERGAHLLAPGPVGVECGFVRDFMLLLAWIRGGHKAQERERLHPCNVCDKDFKSLPALN